MKKNTRSRKWQITLNNYEEHGYSYDKICNILDTEYSKDSLIYACCCQEVGEKGTPHVHIYLYYKNARNFSTIQNKFKDSHIEMAKGSSKENRDYIRKEGKWLDSDKKETNLIETFKEYGECPVEEQGKRNDLNELYEKIENGWSNYEIIKSNPKYINYIDNIDKTRHMILKEEFGNTFRVLETTYICGDTGTGKTKYVMEKYGYSNVYRVTDYEHPFDGYNGQDVIAFEEFRSSLKIGDMLIYLDGYPCELPARFNNKFACYTKVYIISNISIEMQYTSVQEYELKTYEAFCRRIHHYIEFLKGEKPRYYNDYGCYKSGFAYELLEDKERNIEI